jgi:UDP-glucose 4-epimerase
MRVLVTGARGKVGRAAILALGEAGHDVVGTDLHSPNHDPPHNTLSPYVQADLRNPGDAFAVVRGFAAVVHCAAIPTHTSNTSHMVFSNNLMSTFHVAEAAVSFGITRVVNISSAAVSGYATAERETLPGYLPTDENETPRPQEPYALSKHFGEQIMDAVVRRSDVRCISLRPSWVQRPHDYAANLGVGVRNPPPCISRWSYVDLTDLARAIVLAVESDLPGHEAFHVAAADNATTWPLARLVTAFFADRIRMLPLSRPDASPVSSEKAARLLAFIPRCSWRDYLDDEGHPHLKRGPDDLKSFVRVSCESSD